MKFSELHRLLKQNGAEFLYQKGSSHVYYKINGNIVCVPFHGSKEVAKGTLNAILRQAGLK